MEAATKKRGRPRKYETMENIFSDKEPRAAQNLYHATVTIEQFAEGKTDSFFVTARGNIRRQGIAEQIGRMYNDGIITDQQARELVMECKKDYDSGATVKEIERKLRALRKIIQEE